VVPTGFPRVARVLHPAEDGGTSYAQIAASTGRTVHSLVQWAAIATKDFSGHGRSGLDPSEGSAPEHTLRAILRHCPAEGDVVHAVWTGWGSWYERPEASTLMPGWGAATTPCSGPPRIRT
jgi:hypothetical protein